MRERHPVRRCAMGIAMCLSLLGCVSAAHPQSASDGQNFALVDRGRYLAVLGDCGACHTDPAQNRPFAGGRLIETPFGNVAAPNITPDRQTGIGGWSDEEFDAALRQGIAPHDTRLYPAMPYPYYTKMSREDVIALRAYLNTVQPVRNVVVANQLPFPYRIRTTMWLWNSLYFTAGEFKTDPTKSPGWNRGAYLVEGPGHCGACHTPKNRLGGDMGGKAYQGYSLQGWFAPDITNDRARGLADWSAADIVQYLKTGHNRVASAAGPMGEEVQDSSSHWSTADLEALAAYLKDRPGQGAQSRPLTQNDERMTAGAAIYGDLCAACHKADGSGVPYLIPDLAASAAVASTQPTSLFQVVLRGAQSVATDQEPTGAAMPAYGWQLDDAQVAAVLTYIRNSWGHAAAPVSAADSRSARASLNRAD